MPVLLFVAFAALVVVLIATSMAMAAKRRQAFVQFATAHQLIFDPGDDHGLMDRYPEFGCLRQGTKGRKSYNHLRGSWRDREMLAFDYRYQTTSTDSKGHTQTHSHYFSAVILKPELPLRPLLVRPEGLLDKLGQFFGMDDINFESAQFSRRFHVSAKDRKWAYDVLHTRTIERLLADDAYSIQFHGRAAIIWQSRCFEPPQIASAANLLCDVLDGLPEYVRQELGQGGDDARVI
jgi:hypothetical protein